MNLRTQKVVASKILKVGKNRVWINPDYLERVNNALTKQDIRNLIESGVIKKRRIIGTSNARAKKIKIQKKKGYRTGQGNRKGTKNARKNSKTLWITKIRALRRHLKRLKTEEKINIDDYRHLYSMSSGGFFRNKKHMDVYIEKKVKQE